MKGYEMVEHWTLYELKFYFISSGRKNVMKTIGFVNLRTFEEKELYNLGFGDYDFETTDFDDNSKTDNNDGRKVFNTVLYAIKRFFEVNPDSVLLIRGSDSRPQFRQNCQLSCKRKCGVECRKFNQRIRIYRNYLDKHFKELNKEYEFFGGCDKGFVRDPYISGQIYDRIYLQKKDKS